MQRNPAVVFKIFHRISGAERENNSFIYLLEREGEEIDVSYRRLLGGRFKLHGEMMCVYSEVIES